MSSGSATKQDSTAVIPVLPVQRPLRIGLIVADPLRATGLQVFFEENAMIQIVSLPCVRKLAPEARPLALNMVILSTQDTSQLFETIKELRMLQPLLPMIVMAPPVSDEFVERVLRVGARGYLAETATYSEVHEAITEVHAGSIWATRRVMTRLVENPPMVEMHGTRAVFANGVCTARELEVLQLLVAGQSNREIAAAMKIEERTVKSHVAHLLRKVGVKNRIALTMHAIERNIVGGNAMPK